MELLDRQSATGFLSVHVGLPTAERHDPQRLLSTVRSGLKELTARTPNDRVLVQMMEEAQREIAELPLEARHRSLVYYRATEPGWSFWRSLQADLPDFFAFDRSPQVRHLIALLDESPSLGVVVVSQDRARAFTWRTDVWQETAASSLREMEEPAESTAGTAGQNRSTVPANRSPDRTRRWLTQVSAWTGELCATSGWERLLLVGPTSASDLVVGTLPDTCRRILIGSVDRNLVNSPASEIRELAAQELHSWKRREELAQVERLLDAAHSGGRASVGIEPCLASLQEGKVDRLYVVGDLHASGYRDRSGRIYLRRPLSGDGIVEEPRLVERMVTLALGQGAQVIPLEGESARRLNLMGGMGAHLRWKNGSPPSLRS